MHAWEQGVPMRWVTGDEVYGDSPRLRETIQAHGRFYVLAVSANTRVWSERPAGGGATRADRWTTTTRATAGQGAPTAQMVSEVVASLPSQPGNVWQCWRERKDPSTYQWARTQVVESRDQLPGRRVAAGSSLPPDPKQLAYYLAYAPARTSLETLVRVASTRYTVEQCIEEAKGETGLDEYEVRFWHSWYRHITLSMMAHAWLASIRQQEQGKKAPERMSLPG